MWATLRFQREEEARSPHPDVGGGYPDTSLRCPLTHAPARPGLRVPSPGPHLA